MANFGKDLQDRCVHIRSAEQTEHFTVYVISVAVGSYSWTVKHRYSEFYDLHERLTASYKLDKTLLPPKKIFGNQTEAFIKKRQRELEVYLQTIILYLAQHIPSCLAYFLDFDKYEIHGITQSMAEDLYNRGESLLQTKEQYEVSTLQLYSLTERLKLPEPTCDSGDVKKDLGHILDFITRAKHLKVVSSKKPVGSSNILMNKLPFDLTLFKSLQTLEISGCNFRLVNGLETVKQTLMEFYVHESSSSIREILLQDASHWRAEDGSLVVGYWDLVIEVDFSQNSFSDIPDSVQLMPNVEKLNLSHNAIESIQNLQWLSQLTYLDLSHNNIRHVDSLHTKMGNVKIVKLAHNRLESLHGFAKLFSLEKLDVSHNKISAIEELRYISQLPCVENILLVGNAVTNTLDYRTKTLEMFGDRVREITLDNQPTDQKELDTVAVLQALRKAKDIKVIKKPKKNASAVSLSEYSQGSPTHSITDQVEGKNGRTDSPGPGLISRSVPSVSEWPKKDNSSNRSTSPYSQESVSSCVVQESDGELVSEAHPFEFAAAASELNTQPKPGDSNNLNTNNSNDEACSYPHELVPEAHPFDLTIENPASVLSSSHQYITSRSIDNARSPRKTSSLASTPPVWGQSPLASPKISANSPLKQSGSSPAFVTSSQGGHSEPSDKRKLTVMYSVADLPTLKDPGFVLWLNEQLLTTGDVTPVLSPEESFHTNIGRKEAILDIFWCYAEQLSQPGLLHPCCVVLTKTKIFIEKMIELESNFPGVPELEPFSIIPMGNIQQLVIGQCHAFVRLEEAFVGSSGTVTLFGVEPQGVRRFTSRLLEACNLLDVNNIPDCLNLAEQSDLLGQIVAKEEEKTPGMASDRLVVAILVRLKGNDGFNFLVLSENSVYCLDTSFIHWPPPSFETKPEDSIRFNIVHEYSITDRISDIKIHPHQDSFHQCVDGAAVEFVQYGLTLEVSLTSLEPGGNPTFAHCDTSVIEAPPTCVSYLFSSAAYRDLFLDRLTNLRAEQAHRMSPTHREEPEGGNEQVTTPDSGGKQWNTSQKSVQQQPALSRTPQQSQTVAIVQGRSQAIDTRNVSGLYKDMLSGSVKSDKSYGIISLTESDIYGHSPPCANMYHSASPKDDLSVSPMSNFSRASISPPVGHQDSIKKVGVYSNVTADIENIQRSSAAKADSLPSSFDWKRYYFRPPVTSTDTGYQSGSSDKKNNRMNLQIQIPGVLEDIESSSEFDPSSQAVETDHELYLKQCVKSYDLIHPLPTKLKPLCLMNGRELKKFFHTVISKTMPEFQDLLREELHHVVWTGVVPYTNPKHEIVTLVMLSTHSIYLVSDSSPQLAGKSRPSWMTHSRNQSDSAITWKTEASDSSGGNKLVSAYFSLAYNDLQQVNVGLFDQCVRLTGSNENSVFTLATRDSTSTDVFVQKLKHILSLRVPSPMIEKTKAEMEQDFYQDSSQRVKSTTEGIVFTHPSKVSFVYPGEDAVRDILYLVKEKVFRGSKTVPSSVAPSLWFYIQCYQLALDEKSLEKSQPRSVIVTQSHFCLAVEDIVTYPLPDFVRGLPENPCHEIVDCRRIDCLKRVTLYHGNQHVILLTFSDEVEDIVVDVSIEHFSPSTKGRLNPNPEISYKLYVQSMKERDRFVRVVEKLWKQLVSQVGRILDVVKV
ncbi:uncharacterized protein LOC131939378 [Physella acuta]|uniref:uncharacterized protein LOC131939378 n=1 Tax=Physella acuta TaxID=109671 RepID=UPI0027DCDCA1|nr:uncharacterized protein LOC131939378 [Physella acuta]